MTAVLLGVSFMCGTAILADTVQASFDEMFVDTYGRIDVVVRGGQTVGRGFGTRRVRVPTELRDRLASVPGVAAAEGQVEGVLRVIDARGKPMYNPQAGPPTIGLNWLATPELNGWTVVEGAPPAAGDEVVFDRRTVAESGYRVGDTVKLSVATGTIERRLVGSATYSGLDTYSGSPAVLLTTADAQTLIGEPGRFDWVSVVAAPGTSPEQLADAVRAEAIPEVDVLTGMQLSDERRGFIAEFVTLLTQVISAFGAIALFVGSFIISNTFAIIVAQRSRELAVLRAVGASRRQVLQSVLLEALAVGVSASLLGVVAGVGVGRLLRTLIAAFGFALPDTPLRIVPSRAVLPLILGIGVTVVAALVPALKAARTPPVAALREVAVDRPARPRLRLLISAPFFVAAGLVLRLALSMSGDAAPGVALFAAVPAIIGLAVAGPVIAPPVAAGAGRILPFAAGITGRMARRNAVRNPTRTSSTACALAIGVSLVSAIAVLAASLSATVERTADRSIAGDFVVLADGFGGVSPAVAPLVSRLDGVDVATGLRGGQVAVRGRSELALAGEPAALSKVIDLGVQAGSLDRLGPDTVAIASTQARRDNVKIGDRVPVTFTSSPERGDRDVEVVAIYDRALTRNGEYLFAHAGWDPNVAASARVDQRVLIMLRPGVDRARMQATIEGALAEYPTAEVLDADAYRERQVGQVLRRISYLYALLALTVLVGLLGVVNTLLLSVHERRREIGLLRAVGSRRRQISLAVLQEAGLIAAPGALFGVLLGLLVGRVVVGTIRFDEAIVFAAPVGWLVAIGLGACACALVAGVYPATRAGRFKLSELAPAGEG